MKNLNLKFAVVGALAFISFTSCQKAVDSVKDRFGGNASTTQFVEHLIVAGGHNTNNNGYRAVNTSAMNFIVKFDNSAMYQTVIPDNQHDINKLYGFSDNNQEHHLYSARIGWRWINNALSLFAYVYNNGVMTSQEIIQVPLDQEINCSIKVQGSQYLFTVSGMQVTMPRAATTETAVGYQLYPYFGGDETAPHDIRIQIKDL
jgi:hypothetical protein